MCPDARDLAKRGARALHVVPLRQVGDIGQTRIAPWMMRVNDNQLNSDIVRIPTWRTVRDGALQCVAIPQNHSDVWRSVLVQRLQDDYRLSDTSHHGRILHIKTIHEFTYNNITIHVSVDYIVISTVIRFLVIARRFDHHEHKGDTTEAQSG